MAQDLVRDSEVDGRKIAVRGTYSPNGNIDKISGLDAIGSYTVELGALNTKLAGLLHHSQIGEVQTLVLGNWCLVMRLEERLPAQLDEPMQKRLLQERFEEWLRSQVQALNEFDQRWFGITPEQQTSL
ncbi:hypothetical protein H6F88_04320 [Oculatella sp. FACHB-28]|uniref:hypothetical protein n=2 Tax=Cyanophyceae TaxID=3028117 RepID=UPI001686CB62|nr:hypothetical protein [Oculatella sp. FACHB-28]MBD2055255.1 hypothetical protein [Oculatella sp. FACHB-28]